MKIAQMVLLLANTAKSEAYYSAETYASFSTIFESIDFECHDINTSMREITFDDGSKLIWHFLKTETPYGSFDEI